MIVSSAVFRLPKSELPLVEIKALQPRSRRIFRVPKLDLLPFLLTNLMVAR